MRKSAIQIGGGRLRYEPSRYYKRLEDRIQGGTKRQRTDARSRIEEQYKLWNHDKTCPVDNHIIDKAWSEKIHGNMSHKMWLELLNNFSPNREGD